MKPDGGPAFPDVATGDGVNYREGYVYSRHLGMSLRDYFAGLALGGMLTGEANAVVAKARQTVADKRGIGYVNLLVQESYELADAMLAERSKP